MSTETHQITVSGVRVTVIRKAIKNLHLGVYPPHGRVRVAAPLTVSAEAVRLEKWQQTLGVKVATWGVRRMKTKWGSCTIAAHPGAEQEIFPQLAARRPVVVSYTATSWRKLLAAPKGWTGRVPSAGDCYRFCLSSPHVDVALTGPRTIVQLRENLAALERGPLSAEEDTWMRAVGRAVHG